MYNRCPRLKNVQTRTENVQTRTENVQTLDTTENVPPVTENVQTGTENVQTETPEVSTPSTPNIQKMGRSILGSGFDPNKVSLRKTTQPGKITNETIQTEIKKRRNTTN